MSRKHWTSEKLFYRLLTNRSTRTYWDNIRELRRRPSSSVHSHAIQLCKSNSENEIQIGVDVLAQLGFHPNPRFGKTETLKMYFSLLDENISPKTLSKVLSGIGWNNENLSSNRIKKLLKFINHPFSEVRYALVHALMGLENSIAVNAMIILTRDSHPLIRDWATFSIGSQIVTSDSNIIEALWQRIDDDPVIRKEAIIGLASRKDKGVKEILKKELINIDNHGSPILEAIVLMEDMDFIELLDKQIFLNRNKQTVPEDWLSGCKKQLLESQSKDE